MAALADPTRRAMIERLSQRPSSVSELAAPFSMSLAAVVQHIQVLESCGAVITEKRGRVRQCKVNMKALAQIGSWINERQRFWQEQFDNLDTLLDSLPDIPAKTRRQKP
ncbi:helix-turn-helix transcriptional regulator [Aestuariivirga litoralis]|nr:helix-turn-helix transcriptional regulator [Aestuariivirga litoralis]